MNLIKEADRVMAEMLIDSVMKDYDACGLAAAIIDSEGNTQYEIFRGFRDQEKQLPVNEDTIFGIASVTKSFTAMSIIKLAEEGKLSLSDPVSKHIPAFTNKNTKTVTIAHLLSHAGGFFPLPRILVNDVMEELGMNEETDGDPAYNVRLAEEGVKRVASRLDGLTAENGLNGVPGEYLSYCNDGFGLLSDIIRTAGGYPTYPDYLNEEILKPLGMSRSFCDFIRPSKDDNAAVLCGKENGEAFCHRDYHDNAFVLHGGGAMKSTLKDLKKYLAVYLNEGKSLSGQRILSSYSIREMVKPRQPYGHNGSYGYGLSSSLVSGMLVHGHGGSLPGVSSNIAFSYDNDCAVIVLCNTSGVPVSVISDVLIRMYAGLSPVDQRETFSHPWSDELVEAVTGSYASGEGTSFEIFRRPDGTPGLRQEGAEKELLTTSPYTALVRNKYTDTPVRPVFNEEKGVFAVRFGSRLIPKIM